MITPSLETLQSNLNNALSDMQAATNAFDEAIALHGDGTDETLDHYSALGDAAYYLLQQTQQCVELGFSVLLKTDYDSYTARTFGNNIFNTDLIKFSSIKGSPFALEGVCLRYVNSITIQED